MPSRPFSGPLRGRTRLTAFALVACLALVAAACGSGDGDADISGGGGSASGGGGGDLPACPVGAYEDADGVTEITLWHAWVGLTKRTVESIAEDYNASQDKVKVNVESQGNYEEMLAKYESSLADPESLPDMILSEDTTTQFMIDSQTILPAQSCIDADPDAAAFYDQVLPAVTAGWTVEDVLWPSAFSVSQPILYVNENHLHAAGVDTTTLPATLDELRAAAEKIKAANVTGVEKPLVLRLDAWYLEHLLTGSKQEIVNESNGRAGLATESELLNDDTTKVYEWFRSMYDDGLLNAIPYSQPYDQLFAMALGTSSMLIDTSTAITSVNSAIEGTLKNEDIGAEDLGIDLSTFKFDTLKIGVGLNPGFTEAGQGQIGGAGWYMVDRGDDAATSASWDFLSYFNETPNQVRWTLEGSYLPVSEAARNDPALQKDFAESRRGQWLGIASSALDELDPEFPGPVFGPYNQFRAAVRDSFEKITLGQDDVAATITAVNDKFQTDLESYASEVGG
ncbi:MAG: extracellular solute-binding protein [Actinomycetota bacterium]|nr:extracellular solute-binding protein [Actinomycetota bacterium]